MESGDSLGRPRADQALISGLLLALGRFRLECGVAGGGEPMRKTLSTSCRGQVLRPNQARSRLAMEPRKLIENECQCRLEPASLDP